MASTINFDNYIKRFCDTMRGVQRILFVGEGFDIHQYPALASQAWKCIYTTSREVGFADAFSLADRQVRPIYTKKAYDAATTKLDRKNPLCIYLKGCDAVDDDADDFDLEFEREEDAKSLKETLATLLKSDLLVELCIVGYNPFNQNDYSSRDFYSLARTLSDNRITFFGLNAEQEADRFIAELVKKGIATVFEQNLGDALEKYDAAQRTDSDDFAPVILESNDLKTTVYINDQLVRLNQNLCYDFNKCGRVLTLQEMATGTISRMMQVDFFYQFLKRSPNAPQWYGYTGRNGFAVRRDYEQELYDAVIDGLENNRETPVLLAGQTSSGKSVALAALAYRIFQEHKYPVLFVNNPDITFSADSPAGIALDNILKEMKDHGGCILVILDWSVYNLQRNHIIDDLSRKYNNRGHKVLFVASAMYADKVTDKYRIVQAPSTLTEKEKKAFKDLLIEKGKLPRNKVEKWMQQWMQQNNEADGLLSMLYRLVYDLHPQLELGMKQEISKALDDTKEGLKELENPIFAKKPLSPIAEQLMKLGYALPEQSENPVYAKEQIMESLQPFSESLAVASLFKLRMPMTMAMHLLNIPECDNRQQYRDVVFNAPWIHYAMDDDEYAPGEYYVSFRNPMDARIYLESVNKSDADKMHIVAQVIRTMNGDKDSFYSDEIRFLEKLIRMVGPNSDDVSVNERWYYTYGPGCVQVIDALAELRESGIVEPQLVAQEITYIREYYGSDYQTDIKKRIFWLEKAIRIAREVLERAAHPNIDTEDWQQGLVDSITVESIFAELKLERCYAKAAEEGVTLENTEMPLLYSYAQRSQLLQEIITGQPENSYAYTALLSCFNAQYAGNPGDVEMFASMADILGIIDITASSIPRVENNEHYQGKKMEFYRLFDQVCGSTRTEHYFDELLEKGSAVGVYIKASILVRKAGIKYNLALTDQTKKACKQVLDVLEDQRYSSIVRNHAAIQYMRLQLTWLYHNGRPVFERERQTTWMEEKDWIALYQICSEFRSNIIERQPECPYKATVYYIMALACAQLGDFEEASQIWRAVDEDDFYGLGRSYTWHVLCKAPGEPRLFTGTFNVPMLQDNKIFIKDIQKPVFYRSLQSINKSASHGEAADLCIGTSYRGLSAFARNWKARREQ